LRDRRLDERGVSEKGREASGGRLGEGR